MTGQRGVLTGANGELRYNGGRVSKCKNFSVEVMRDALEDTSVGDDWRTYIEGLRGGSGSATVLYDSDDNTTLNLLNSILGDADQQNFIEMLMDTTAHKGLAFDAILTQVGTPVAAGEVTACSISFQVTGKIRGGF